MNSCRSGPTNSARKPTFNQLDFRIDRTWTFKAWQFGVYADLQNIYNAENPEGTIYDYRCRTSIPIRGVPFYPILGHPGDVLRLAVAIGHVSRCSRCGAARAAASCPTDAPSRTCACWR